MRGSCSIFLVLFGIWLWMSQGEATKLNPSGTNVCSRKFSYNSYVPIRKSYTSYDNYRTCCKKILAWCSSKCTKYRTKIRYYYHNILKVRYSTSYFCCSGWARAGSECTKAICNPPCENGDCIAPNVCKCKKGFLGKTCETEINECNATPRPCEQTCTNLRGSYACSCNKGYRKIGTGPQDKKCENVNECAASDRLCKCAVSSPRCKATCVDTIGSYRCQCNAGFRLILNKICTDTDECQTGKHNCEHICVNDRGGFKCACRVGYWLRNDQRSCYDLNECRAANGGCDQICTNTPGSYKCSCRDGFRLVYDKTRCQDVDECISIRPCDKYRGKCLNTFGSYRCGCDKGYELTENQHTCTDLDECKRINDCGHTCHNTDGSYFCSCKSGYKLAYDKRKCIDVDECKEGLHDCDQICRNIPGSFRCACRPEYVLHTDKKTCKPIPCKTLYSPVNGLMKCNGTDAGDKCYFSCKEGYELIGNPIKTCMINSRWSDEQVKCKPMKCPRIHPPKHGALLLPCVEVYSSQCIVKCRRGFLLHGNPVLSCGLEDSKARWKNYNVTCEELNACKPNPCVNGGKCRPISRKNYKCDCEETGFGGKNCEVGMFVLPKFPQLVSGVESDILVIKARVLRDVSITPEAVNGEAIFTPATISFTAPQREARFKVKATGRGLIRVKYIVSGKDRLIFAQPPDNFLYLINVDPSDQIKVIPNNNFVDTQCQKLTIGRCPDGEAVQLLSTCKWNSNGTLGYQSVKHNQTKLPLSLAGLTQPIYGGKKWRYNSQGILTVAKETAAMMKTGVRPCLSSSCTSSEIRAEEHKFIIQANLFLKSFLDRRNQLSPWWSSLRLVDHYSGFHVNNLQTLLVRGDRLKSLTSCTFPMKTTGLYSVNVNFAPLQIKLLSQRQIIKTPNPTCIAIDVCGGMSFMSFPKDIEIDLDNTLQSIGIKSLSLKLEGIGTLLTTTKDQEMFCHETRNALSLKSIKFCLKPTIWAPIQAAYKSPHANISLRGQVFVEPSSIDKFVLQMFKTESKAIYKGDIEAKFQFMAGGRPFVIDVLDSTNNGKATSVFGGTSLQNCEVCSKKGITLRTVETNVEFLPLSSLVTFHRTKGTVVQFHLNMDMAGGRVEKIAELSRLYLFLRRAERSFPRDIQRLLFSIRRVASKYQAETNSLNDLKAKFTTKLSAIRQTASQANPDFKKMYVALNELHSLVTLTEDTLRLLNARILKFETSTSFKSSFTKGYQLMQRRLQQLLTKVDIAPSRENVLELDSGFSMTYDGILCFHALCFGKLMATMHDLSSHCKTCQFGSLASQESIIVNGIFKEDMTYRGIIAIKKGTSFNASVHKQRNEFSMAFMADVSAFGKVHSVLVKVDNNKISMRISKAVIDKNVGADLEIFATVTEQSRWKSLSFQVKGVVENTSPVVSKLEKFAEEYVKVAQTQTRVRLQKVNDRVNLTTQELLTETRRLKEARKLYQLSNDTYNTARIRYLRKLVNFNRTRIEFRSYRVGSFFQNLEKTLDKACTFKTCKQICLSVPTCDVCQRPVFADADTVKCEQKQRSVITTVEEPLKTKCTLVRYRFTPIYTGTCKKGKSQKLTGALVATGTGVGTLAGMAIAGPVGAAIGGAIGAAVGVVGSLFSSCDESYEVHKEVFNIQLPCTRKIFNPRTKKFTESVCYTVVKSVFSTYDVPEECNCNNGTNSTCVNVINPNCIKDNQECRRRRESLVRTSMESAGQYNSTYFRLNKADEDLRVALVVLNNAEQDKIGARKKYERQVAVEKKYRLDARLANQSLENSIGGLRLERCLMRLGDKLKSSAVYRVGKIEFQSKRLRPVDVLFALQLKSNEGISFPENFLVYDFDDEELSLKKGAEKFVRNLYCKAHTRRRRSLGDTTIHTASFDAQHVSGFSTALISSAENVTESNAACLVYTRITEYVNKAFSTLARNLESSLERKRNLQQSITALKDAGRRSKDNKGELIVDAQVDLLKIMEKRADAESKREENSVVLSSWRKEMEIFSSANNFTSCINFLDCVEQSLIELKNLPGMFRNERKVFDQILHELGSKVEGILTEKKQIDLKMVNSLLESLKLLKAESLFCADVPKVELLEQEKVESRIGAVVQLHCEAKSELNVKYQWFHNDSILPNENGRTLSITVDHDAAGRYKCEVISKAGKNVSSDTFIVVGETPSVFIEPQSFTYYSSMDKKIVPSFHCNVTAEPPPTITWYKVPFEDASKEIQLQFTSPAMRFVSPKATDSAWYFCEAKNIHSKVRSKWARFDVVNSNFPNQALEMKFDVDVSGGAVPQKSEYEKRVRDEGELGASHLVNVSLKFQPGNKINLGIKITDDVRSKLKSSARYRRDTSGKGYKNDNSIPLTSDLDILRKVSETRQALAGSLQKIADKLTHRTRRSVGSSISDSVRKSLEIGFNGNLCPEGYQLHDNGFTCVQCTAGHFEYNRVCVKCPKGTYQSQSGKDSCIECHETLITAGTGATSKKECISADLQYIDVLFLLDSSGSLGEDNWKRVIQFVSGFVDKFVDSKKRVRVGVIVYSTIVQLEIPLRQYQTPDLKRQISRLSYQAGMTRTYNALDAARRHLLQAKVSGNTQLAIVITDGKSSSSAGIPGFILTRSSANKLIQAGVHVFSVGVGSLVDPTELLSIASFPKEKNFLGLKDFSSLAGATSKIVASALRGYCSLPSTDIAVVVELSHRIGQDALNKTTLYLTGLLDDLRSSDDKVGLFTIGNDITEIRSYAAIKSEEEIKNALSKLKVRSEKTNFKHGLQRMYNEYLTEKFSSLSKRKLLLVLTKDELDENSLQSLRLHYPEDEVTMYNIVMTVNDVEEDIENVGIGVKRSVFSLSQLTELQSELKSELKALC